MPRPRLTAAILTAALAVAAAVPAHASDGAALDRALERLVAARGGPPGAVSVVQRGRSVAVHTAGVADVRTRRRIAPGDRMRLASTAKAFSGAVALALVARGRLSLDDTIGARLPDLPAAWGAVTLRQLLHHTSGVPDYSSDPTFQRRVNAAPRTPLSPRRLLAFVADRPLGFVPGSRYRYSNSDNIVVALMAEAATGRSYVRNLGSLVFGPLGLRRTSLPVGAGLVRPFIHGYHVEPPRPPEDISSLLAAALSWASGGVVSTPADLNRFARGYAGRRLFGRAVQAQQLRFVPGTSEPPGPGTNAAGLAVFRYRTRCGTVYGHTGNTPGYTQFFAATLDGRRSATVSVSEQLTPTVRRPLWTRLRQAQELAVCAALA
jgi:D-alanyl-D-alanine carboxypeptidase